MSFGSKAIAFKNRGRSITLNISKANIKDQIVAFLHQTTHLKPSDDVVDMEFILTDNKDIVPIKIYLKKEVSKVNK